METVRLENTSGFNAELDQILERCRPFVKEGRVATYIPELAKADPEQLGVYVIVGDRKSVV